MREPSSVTAATAALEAADRGWRVFPLELHRRDVERGGGIALTAGADQMEPAAASAGSQRRVVDAGAKRIEHPLLVHGAGLPRVSRELERAFHVEFATGHAGSPTSPSSRPSHSLKDCRSERTR